MHLLQFTLEGSEMAFKRRLKKEGGMDCAVCALEHLNAITDRMGRLLRTMAFRRGLFIAEIGAILAYLTPTMTFHEHNIQDLFGFLNEHLLPGNVTLLGMYYENAKAGHMALVGRKLNDHNFFLMDSDHSLRGVPAITQHLISVRALPTFTLYLTKARSHITPSPKIRSQTQHATRVIQAIRDQYTNSALLEIPGLTPTKIRQLRTCPDIPSFLHIMGIIDTRLKRLLQILPLPDMSYLAGLLDYQLGLLYEPIATTRGKLRVQEGCVTIAFASKKLDKFWYVGCYGGKIGAIDPHNNEKTGTVVYVMKPSEMEQGEIIQ